MNDQRQFGYNPDNDMKNDLDMGGSSAGAQDGGIVDTGSADDDTDYADSITGRKGGMIHNDIDEDYVGTGDFDMDDTDPKTSGVGTLGDFDTVGTDHGMPGTWAGGESTSNSSGL